MPGARPLVSSATAGILVGLVVDLWMHWPTFLAVAIGALFGVGSLIVTGSLTRGSGAAEAAWRQAAPDLHARAAAPGDPDPARRPGDTGR